jgi:hypothetical protein
MDTGVIIAIVVIAVLAVLAVAAFLAMQRRQSGHLRERFGPEYDRTLASSDGKRDAERELSEREKRVEKLCLREIEPEQRTAYAEEWKAVQARFVDQPAEAVGQADELVQRVMEARGYPLAGFDRQAADISVDHPEVVTNYRAAHAIAETSRKDGATTEELRQAMVHYRELFCELLGAVAVR